MGDERDSEYIIGWMTDHVAAVAVWSVLLDSDTGPSQGETLGEGKDVRSCAASCAVGRGWEGGKSSGHKGTQTPVSPRLTRPAVTSKELLLFFSTVV